MTSSRGRVRNVRGFIRAGLLACLFAGGCESLDSTGLQARDERASDPIGESAQRLASSGDAGAGGPNDCQPAPIRLHPARVFAAGTTPEYLRVADLDADGALDVVVSTPDDAAGMTTLDLLRGSETGELELVSRVAVSAPGETVVSDFDGDVSADIVGVAFDGQGPLPSFYLRGLGHFAYETTSWRGLDWLPFLHAADFDEDGVPEIVAAHSDSQSEDGLPAGFRILTVPAFTTVQDQPSSAAGEAITGDFDGDGHQDLLAVAAPGSVVQLYRGDGGGQVQIASAAALPGATRIRRMLPVDLDADGRADVVVSHGDGWVSIVHGRCDGFSDAQRVATGLASTSALAAGDFDHDGRLDIAVSSLGEPRIALLVARGSGFQQAGFLDAPNARSRSLAAADLDGDGWDELISPVSGGIAVFYSDPLPGAAQEE